MQVGDPPADLAEGELFGDALDGRQVRRRRRLRHGAAHEAAAAAAGRGRLLGGLDVLEIVAVLLLLEVVEPSAPYRGSRRRKRGGTLDAAVDIPAGVAKGAIQQFSQVVQEPWFGNMHT